MEGMRDRLASARAVIVVFVTIAIVACVSACASAAPTSKSPIPTLGAFTPGSTTATIAPEVTEPDIESPASASDIPDAPVSTKATALIHPQRGSAAPVGAVVFGNDVTEGAKAVNVTGERTLFTAGHQIAWRVTLPDAIGGESVRVTLTGADNSEKQIDEFVAQPGWNVYYGKSLLTVAPGTYVLHYLVDGHEQGSGTFKIRGPDAVVPAPTAAATSSPS
jgi:hypothetical protein